MHRHEGSPVKVNIMVCADRFSVLTRNLAALQDCHLLQPCLRFANQICIHKRHDYRLEVSTSHETEQKPLSAREPVELPEVAPRNSNDPLCSPLMDLPKIRESLLWLQMSLPKYTHAANRVSSSMRSLLPQLFNETSHSANPPDL